MLSGIFISALLAGPAAAGVMARQNTVTVNHTVTSISTSTVFAYVPSGKPAAFSYVPSSSASALSLNAPNASAPEQGLNPINGLPAAPPHRPESVTSAPAPSSTVIKPIVISKINGSLTALYKTGPASTFAIQLPSGPAPKPSSSSASTPLLFRTYTSTKGAAAPTATNSPRPTESATASSSPTLTRSIQSSSAPSSALQSTYSSLLRAPPQFPTLSTSKQPAKETPSVSSNPTSSTSAAPAPTPTETKSETEEGPSSSPSSPSSSSEATEANPYPYPTPLPEEPEEPTSFSYPYPTA